MVTEKQNLQSEIGTGQPPRPRTMVDVSPDPPTSFRQDLFSLPEGAVTVSWPATISQESFQDVADWLPILERKIKRSVKSDGA